MARNQGSEQRASAGAAHGVNPDQRRFAIYTGNGVYLRSLSKTPDGRHSFGRDRARSYTRQTAVAALHIVRAAGRSAWLVQHPGNAAQAAA